MWQNETAHHENLTNNNAIKYRVGSVTKSDETICKQKINRFPLGTSPFTIGEIQVSLIVFIHAPVPVDRIFLHSYAQD
jgi:hypothetical protein